MAKRPPLSEIVKAIAEFPRRYRDELQLTPRKMFESMRYSAAYLEISQEQIEAIVEHDPVLIEDWVRFSEDKRWTPSWWIAPHGKQWIVGHMNNKLVRDCEIVFDSPTTATAFMIRMEMESFRTEAR